MSDQDKVSKIVPFVESADVTITKFKVAKVVVNIFNNAIIHVKLFNRNNLIRVQNIEMTPQEYELWGADDNFIKNLVSQKLGYTLM